MTERVEIGEAVLYRGDMQAVLAEMPENSFDACCTDPPYMLDFMSKSWDRAAKPPIDADFANWFAGFVDGEGCFSVHKKKVNGFETYDCQFSLTLREDDKEIIYEMQKRLGGLGSIACRPGSKSNCNANPQIRYCISSQRDCQIRRAILDIFPLRAKKRRDFEAWSHALDCWLSHTPGGSWEDMAYYRDAAMAVKKYGSTFSPELLHHYRWAAQVYRVLKPGAYMVAFSSTRTYHRMVCAIEDAGFEIHPMMTWVTGSGFPKATRIKADGYEGQRYGKQSIKPSLEPICFAQKPFSEANGTANILKWGTGAVNIDACRVEADTRPLIEPDRGRATGNTFSGGMDGSLCGSISNGTTTQGRWPPNVLHDGSPEVLDEFAKYGETTSGSRKEGEHRICGSENVYREYETGLMPAINGDSGTPARFYPSLPFDHQDDVPFMYEPKAGPDDRMGFKHPTIKPVNLIRWLCRLITPKGGTIVDPFAGTFTTGQAALAEGFHPTGIEMDPKSFECCIKRIEHVMGADTPLFAEPVVEAKPKQEVLI